MIEFTYLYQPPRKYTFEMPKLLKWLRDECKHNGSILNLFAGKVEIVPKNTYYNIETPILPVETRVDIDTSMPNIDYNMDAYEFVKYAIEKGMKWDCIILDPPYNLRKSREKYGGRYIGSFTKIKDLIPQIATDNCKVISFGYDSVGMSKSRGFEKTGICLICHNGDHQDTIVTVERKINHGLLE